jgi:class 3 adenylate cyclase
MPDESELNPGEPGGREENVDDLLEKRQELDKLFKEKYTKILTVMFTDLKGSTSIADTEGDLASRLFMKDHNAIVMPAIANNGGVLVKTMGDGTMSYFESSLGAVRAAASIQSQCDAYNVTKQPKIPLLVRIGIHTGECVLEGKDLFGDTVNVASRFESAADAGEIFLSESAYQALEDKSEIYCKFLKTVTLKGKAEPQKAFKAYWNPAEMEEDLKPTKPEAKAKKSPVAMVVVALLIIAALAFYLLLPSLKRTTPDTETRSLKQTAPVERPGSR